jgi:O-antigen ligase
MNEVPAVQSYALRDGGPFIRRIDLVLLLGLIPAVVANAPGFSASRDRLVDVAEVGTLESRILYAILALFAVVAVKRLHCPILWSRSAYVFSGYLSIGLVFSEFPSMVVRGLFVAWTSLVVWNVLGYYLAKQGKEVVSDFARRVPVFFLAWGLLETALWWLTPNRFEYGYMGDYIGYFLQPNLLAKLLCVGIIVQFFKIWIAGSTFRDILVIGMLSVLLLGTGSRTSLVALGVAVVATVLTKKGEKAGVKFALLGLMALLIVIGGSFFSEFFGKGDSYGLLVQSTLAFRLDMWQALVPQMLIHPWLGAGLNSFWNPILFETFEVPTTGIHNGYLQVFQDLGIVGLVLLLGAFMPLFRALRHPVAKHSSTVMKYSLVSSWIYFFAVNVAEGEMGNYRSCIWGILMTLSLCWYYLTKKYRYASNNHHSLLQPGTVA